MCLCGCGRVVLHAMVYFLGFAYNVYVVVLFRLNCTCFFYLFFFVFSNVYSLSSQRSNKNTIIRLAFVLCAFVSFFNSFFLVSLVFLPPPLQLSFLMNKRRVNKISK